MQLKDFLNYGFCGASVALFIRASIIPFFAVYGDPFDEMFMSIVSLSLIVAAFAITIKSGSHITGSIMITTGGFYIWNGYRMLMMISEQFAGNSEVAALSNVNMYVIMMGTILVGLGIFSVMRKMKTKISIDQR
jgi:hypothetical protein